MMDILKRLTRDKAAFIGLSLLSLLVLAALFAPLCTEPVVYAQRTKVKGFTPSLLGKMKFDGVYIDE